MSEATTPRPRPKSIFAGYREKLYNQRFGVTLHVGQLIGGTPSDPKVAENWIRKSLGSTNEELLRELVIETVIERQGAYPTIENEDPEAMAARMEAAKVEAIEQVIKTSKLNGFYHNDVEGIWFPGRNIKAAIKEAANIRWPQRRWGPTNKGTMGFWAEHVFVMEDHIPLGRQEPDGVQQRFVHTWRGSGIQYEEYLLDVDIDFTLVTDAAADKKGITADDWGELWATAELQGIGATRGMGYGTYSVTRWERLKH